MISRFQTPAFTYTAVRAWAKHIWPLAIAREVLQKGYGVVYVSAQSAFDAMEKERYSGGDTLAALEAAQLLVLERSGYRMPVALYGKLPVQPCEHARVPPPAHHLHHQHRAR